MPNHILEFKARITQSFANNDAYKRFSTWYKALPARDALILKILAVLTLLVLFYSWLILPMMQGMHSATAKLDSELRFHSKLKDNAYLFNGRTDITDRSNESVLSTVNSVAKSKGIKLKRFEPNGDKGLRIWLEKIKFDRAIDLIEVLEQEKGVLVEQISIDKVESGIVNLRASLKM